MTKRDLLEQELDILFETQQAASPAPSEAFLERIATDAAGAASAAARVAETNHASSHVSVWGRLGAWIGAATAPGGLVAAGLVGLWIGLSQPQLLQNSALLLTPSTDLSLLQLDDWYGLRDIDSLELE